MLTFSAKPWNDSRDGYVTQRADFLFTHVDARRIGARMRLNIHFSQRIHHGLFK